MAAGVVAVALVTWWEANQAPDLNVLAARCASSEPSWSNYDEDLKGSLGARPFAAWEGRPVSASMREGNLVLMVSMEAPWSEYDFGLPLLIRDHLGHIIPGRPEAGVTEATRLYVFPLAAHGVDSAPPWITLLYPRHEMRITLDAEGRWP